nr:hypothetical protein [Tanacetum cinerariifolium]
DKKNRLMRIDELHNVSDGTLNDVRNALDDHLKGIKESLTYARNPVKEILLKVESILSQGTLKGKWRYLIPTIPPIHNHVLIPNYQDFKIQDFRYSDGFRCFQAIKKGRYEHNHVEKVNQQSKDFENQNKDLQDKYDVLKNQTTTFEMNNKELNEQLKELIEKNNDLLAQTKVLKDQLQVKHVVIDTHAECQEKYAKLEAERYEYMIRYSAYFDNDKQHMKQIAD